MGKKNPKYNGRKAGFGALLSGVGASVGAGIGRAVTQIPQVTQNTAVPNVEGGAPTSVPHLVNAAQPVIDAALNHGSAKGAFFGTLGSIAVGLYAHHVLNKDQFGK